LSALVGASLAAVGGWIAYSKLAVDHDMDLPEAIPAPRYKFTGKRAGPLSYYMESQTGGVPLVLVHSVNAAGSAYEMRSIFERFRTQRPVYALDLPGFGFSDRSPREYSPELYEGALLDLVEEVIHTPVDMVALSLGSEFAARAAKTNPTMFRSLALISPSGFRERGGSEPAQANGEDGDSAYRVLSNPLWGGPLYDLLATRPSIRFFLKKSFTGEPPQDFVEYAYLTAHQPGAENAPLYFVSGQLFTRRVRPEIYERLELPVLVLYDQDGYTNFETLPGVLDAHANWKAVRIAPTRGLPHFDKPEETFQVLQDFWSSL